MGIILSKLKETKINKHEITKYSLKFLLHTELKNVSIALSYKLHKYLKISPYKSSMSNIKSSI